MPLCVNARPVLYEQLDDVYMTPAARGVHQSMVSMDVMVVTGPLPAFHLYQVLENLGMRSLALVDHLVCRFPPDPH